MRILPGPEDCDVFSFVSGVSFVSLSCSAHSLARMYFFAKNARKNQGETKKREFLFGTKIAMKNLGET